MPVIAPRTAGYSPNSRIKPPHGRYQDEHGVDDRYDHEQADRVRQRRDDVVHRGLVHRDPGRTLVELGQELAERAPLRDRAAQIEYREPDQHREARRASPTAAGANVSQPPVAIAAATQTPAVIATAPPASAPSCGDPTMMTPSAPITATATGRHRRIGTSARRSRRAAGSPTMNAPRPIGPDAGVPARRTPPSSRPRR